MASKNEVLPKLTNTTKPRRGIGSISISSNPDFGKGFIYAIDWGFRTSRANTYKAVGTYIGLTVQRPIDRFRQHVRMAKGLGFQSAAESNPMYDTKKKPVSKVTSQSPESAGSKLLYLAMATSMGFQSDIEPNTTYRAIKVIDHVNLFDLGFTERSYVGGKVSTKKFGNFSDLAHEAMNSGGRLAFNNSAGGEGSKLNARNSGASMQEIVMAAVLFITEGRGSVMHPNSLKEKIGIEGTQDSLSSDILKVKRYFKKKQGYEKLNARAPDSIETIERYLKELGISITNKGEISDAEDKIATTNLLMRYGADASLSSSDAKKIALMHRQGTDLNISRQTLEMYSQHNLSKEQRAKIVSEIKPKIKEPLKKIQRGRFIWGFHNWLKKNGQEGLSTNIINIANQNLELGIEEIQKHYADSFTKYKDPHRKRKSVRRKK